MASQSIGTDCVAGMNSPHETVNSRELPARCLEIEASFQGSSYVVLSLAGALQTSHLTKLRMLIHSAQGLSLQVSLNLAPLQSANLGALREVLGWQDYGVTILGCPDYVESWVRNEFHTGGAPAQAAQISNSAFCSPGIRPRGMDPEAERERRNAHGGTV